MSSKKIYTGLIEHYRNRLPVSESTQIISLGEGNTPLIKLHNIPSLLDKDVDIYVGTFSKSLGSIGGFVSTKKNIAEYIRHKASAFIFTAALPPASVAGVIEGLGILASDSKRRKLLHKNTAFQGPTH